MNLSTPPPQMFPVLTTDPDDFGWAKMDDGYYNVHSKTYSSHDPYNLQIDSHTHRAYTLYPFIYNLIKPVLVNPCRSSSELINEAHCAI